MFSFSRTVEEFCGNHVHGKAIAIYLTFPGTPACELIVLTGRGRGGDVAGTGGAGLRQTKPQKGSIRHVGQPGPGRCHRHAGPSASKCSTMRHCILFNSGIQKAAVRRESDGAVIKGGSHSQLAA